MSMTCTLENVIQIKDLLIVRSQQMKTDKNQDTDKEPTMSRHLLEFAYKIGQLRCHLSSPLKEKTQRFLHWRENISWENDKQAWTLHNHPAHNNLEITSYSLGPRTLVFLGAGLSLIELATGRSMSYHFVLIISHTKIQTLARFSIEKDREYWFKYPPEIFWYGSNPQPQSLDFLFQPSQLVKQKEKVQMNRFQVIEI